MNNAEKRVITLEKSVSTLLEINKKLQRMLDVLQRRLGAVERKGNNTAHTARVTEQTVSQLKRSTQITEGKVTHVENILRNH